MKLGRVIVVSSFGVLFAGCEPSAPPRWAEGGARLDVPAARWVAGDEVVTIRPDGRVFKNGSFEMAIDRAGRVYDEDNDPIAIVDSDGRVTGTNDTELGRVGTVSAAPPGYDTAWLAIAQNGEVTRFGPEGERSIYGSWIGCNGTPEAALACTLVTHLITLKYQGRERPEPGVSVGIGFGVGFGVGR